MKGDSSATFIAYDLRPAKQTERRILLDFLYCTKEAGLPVSSYRYVGMGGTKFYDFVMMYRFVGISSLISLEGRPKFVDRCQFNKPYSMLQVKGEISTDFLKKDIDPPCSIYWLDYDGALGGFLVDDLRELSANIKSGAMVFVTVAAELPLHLLDQSEQDRLAEIRETFGDLASGLNEKHVEESTYSSTVYVLLERIFKNAFPERDGSKFLPLFKISYKDSVWMLTFGGCYVKRSDGAAIKKSMRRHVPFLLKASAVPYRIRTLNLTERERHLFEFSATARKNSKEANTLRKLGFKKSDLMAYRELARFIPRYFETIF